jgi:hypothetical protein
MEASELFDKGNSARTQFLALYPKMFYSHDLNIVELIFVLSEYRWLILHPKCDTNL